MRFSETVLPHIYRSVLRLSRQRGAMTLGRLNHRIFPNGQHFRLGSGDSFFLPPDPHYFGYLHGHEKHISNIIEKVVEPGDTCFDIGANIGFFTSQMASICGHNGLVVAFEPDETNFHWLKRNVELASEAGYHIKAVQAAVSGDVGLRKVIRGAESTLHTTVQADADEPSAVKAVSVDKEIERLGLIEPVKLLKVDVEGHEPSVLRGMTNSVSGGKIRHAIIEVNPGEQAAEVDTILNIWGKAVTGLSTWRGGEWVEGPVGGITARTDALINFK